MPEKEESDLNEFLELTEYYGDYHHSVGKDYDQSVFEYIYGKSSASSWKAMKNWIEKEHEKDPIFSGAAGDYLLQDIERLIEKDTPFTTNPSEANRLAKKTRYES